MERTISLNYRVIIKILGIIILIIGIAMLPALLCAWLYDSRGVQLGLLVSFVVTTAVGGAINLLSKSGAAKFNIREGYLVVSLCWIVASCFGTLPYLLSGFTGDFSVAFFESVAGFTTTGCTTVAITLFPKALLMWTAMCHWLGGMGILVFVISILPALGVNGQMIARAETPGPVLQKVAVRMSDSAKILYVTYLSFTVVEFLLLNASPAMPTFDAVINTLGSISTGGLLSNPGGIQAYHSLYVELIIACFTLLGSINFLIYGHVLNRRWSNVVKDVEFRGFWTILGGSIVICTAGLYFLGQYPTIGKALRDSFFQVVGIMSTSGYSNTDYTRWPAVCTAVLFCLYFVGGCAASTSGSIKVVRILVLFKVIWRGFYRRVHPKSVVAVKLGGEPVPAPVVSSITVFILMYFVLFAFSCVVLSLQNLDLETTVSTVAGLLSNTGNAMGTIGGASNFGVYAAPLKFYLCFLMIVGRLELFTIIILFTRNFWGKDR